MKPTTKSEAEKTMPPAGPHARPGLTDKEKTPGGGTLPETTAKEKDVDPGAG